MYNMVKGISNTVDCGQHGADISRLVLPDDAFYAEVADLLAQGRTVTVAAKGDSMLPFVRGGRDSVVLQRMETPLSVGDIVLASAGGMGHVLHRIVRIDGDDIVLMGDGNVRQTEHCRTQDVAGCVTHIVRCGQCIDCTSRAERAKSALWRALLPLRRVLLFVLRRWHSFLSARTGAGRRCLCI